MKNSSDTLFKTRRFLIQAQVQGTSKSRRVTILISSKLRAMMTFQQIDPWGQFLFLNITIEGEALTLSLVYAPNEDKFSFLSESLHQLSDFSTGPIILGGDLNYIDNVQHDYLGRRKPLEVLAETQGLWNNCFKNFNSVTFGGNIIWGSQITPSPNDSVEPQYLITLLEHMAFVPKYIIALQAIYREPHAMIQINGASSDPFTIARGTYQGCPLSTLLFALAIESLAETLRDS